MTDLDLTKADRKSARAAARVAARAEMDLSDEFRDGGTYFTVFAEDPAPPESRMFVSV